MEIFFQKLKPNIRYNYDQNTNIFRQSSMYIYEVKIKHIYEYNINSISHLNIKHVYELNINFIDVSSRIN